ncbi:MAG: hypothetical protein FRX49_06861 [Trebouxia sp. A1-2]|nr:MAG: hypothetical protein FRX49_06861 [Trebouxia sp. A1-2]
MDGRVGATPDRPPPRLHPLQLGLHWPLLTMTRIREQSAGIHRSRRRYTPKSWATAARTAAGIAAPLQ